MYFFDDIDCIYLFLWTVFPVFLCVCVRVVVVGHVPNCEGCSLHFSSFFELSTSICTRATLGEWGKGRGCCGKNATICCCICRYWSNIFCHSSAHFLCYKVKTYLSKNATICCCICRYWSNICLCFGRTLLVLQGPWGWKSCHQGSPNMTSTPLNSIWSISQCSDLFASAG